MGQHAKYRTLVGALALGALGGVTQPAHAGGCRLALLLALDVSNSVDPREDRLQREGLAAALLSPPVRKAMLSHPGQPVALGVFEWSGARQHAVVQDWAMIDDRDTLERAARQIATSRRPFNRFSTALGAALGFAADLFDQAPRCAEHTLDISGDGKNNAGLPPAAAYRAFDLGGVTVNALVIGGGTDDDHDLADYFRDHVIQGISSFVEIARDFDDYERAMIRKLERELRPRAVSLLTPAQ